ncbi:protein MANBAL isoform X3 [Chiloscyllium plagiosum]|nr:protein MANBAL isoform X3 [Chiloscyllium plagiosum]XP_043566545.1 protein MANBAL isoform X3 [Chiloscyllium plagiosum]
MASEFDLSPPEVPEPTFFDNVLRYGLFLGAIFQIICILSILLPSSKSSEPGESMPQDRMAQGRWWAAQHSAPNSLCGQHSDSDHPKWMIYISQPLDWYGSRPLPYYARTL